MSHIAKGTWLSGDFATVHDILIDGNFDGRLFCAGCLTIGPEASIKGDIMAYDIVFNGNMSSGNIHARDTLSLKSGCSVNGDLFFQRLAVELDAHFNGRCQVIVPADFEKAAAPVASLLNALPGERFPEETEEGPAASDTGAGTTETEAQETPEFPATPEDSAAPVQAETAEIPEAEPTHRSPLFFLKQAEKRK